jgi:flagellar M-ring protein FliF
MPATSDSRIALQWQQLTLSQKLMLGITTLILIGFAGIIVSFMSVPEYKQLYGHLSETDAGTVVEKLKAAKIKYRLTSGGTALEVPADKVDDLRISLAGEGIPQGGYTGFELFDKPQFGQSEFAEHLNYRRALQGELARTINMLDSIRSSRVLLAIPERSVFITEEAKPSASVLLTLRGSTSPSTREIRTIINLVASSVEGLSPERVEVADNMGNRLSESANVGADGGGNSRTEAKRAVEAQIETRLQSMLDRVFGPEKVIVRANAVLNFDRRKIESETYSPVNSGATQGVLETRHETTESYSGNRPPGAGGISNAVSSLTRGALGAGNTANGADYQHTENANTYRVSKKVEQMEVSPGQVEQTSLAVLVDDSLKDQVNKVRAILIAAAGLNTNKTDATKNDRIEVQTVVFDTTSGQQAEQEAKKQASQASMMSMGKIAAGVVLALVFLFILLAIYRSSLAPKNAPAVLDATQPYQLLPPANQALQSYQSADLMLTGEVNEDAAVADMDPERIAKVIKGLIAEGG